MSDRVKAAGLCSHRRELNFRFHASPTLHTSPPEEGFMVELDLDDGGQRGLRQVGVVALRGATARCTTPS